MQFEKETCWQKKRGNKALELGLGDIVKKIYTTITLSQDQDLKSRFSQTIFSLFYYEHYH